MVCYKQDVKCHILNVYGAAMKMNAKTEWFEDYIDDSDEAQVDEYDIVATPNDFNVSTLFNFVESGAVRINESLIMAGSSSVM